MALFGKSKKQKAQELVQSGSRGAGTVVSVQDTGTTINDNPRVKMVFRVEPLDGGQAFDLEKKATVSRLEIPRQGDRYPVYYDPQDSSNWAYATIVDDAGRESIRQMFGDVADTFVGMGVPNAPAATDTATQLKQLAELRDSGVLTDDEFEAQKGKLLG